MDEGDWPFQLARDSGYALKLTLPAALPAKWSPKRRMRRGQWVRHEMRAGAAPLRVAHSLDQKQSRIHSNSNSEQQPCLGLDRYIRVRLGLLGLAGWWAREIALQPDAHGNRRDRDLVGQLQLPPSRDPSTPSTSWDDAAMTDSPSAHRAPQRRQSNTQSRLPWPATVYRASKGPAAAGSEMKQPELVRLHSGDACGQQPFVCFFPFNPISPMPCQISHPLLLS